MEVNEPVLPKMGGCYQTCIRDESHSYRGLGG